MKKFIIRFLIGIFLIGVFFRLFCGIFVIQPIGAIPEGATIIYWRSGINLNVDFISSADGILEKARTGVSLLGRGVILGKVAEPIKKREIFRFKYS
jgi:hypothetical protein